MITIIWLNRVFRRIEMLFDRFVFRAQRQTVLDGVPDPLEKGTFELKPPGCFRLSKKDDL